MIKYKLVTINSCIVLCYFLTYLLLTWNTSGGDIFLIFIYLVTLFFHILTILIIFFKRKGKLWQALSGVGIAVVICFLVYKNIEYKKNQVKPKIEVSSQNSMTNPIPQLTVVFQSNKAGILSQQRLLIGKDES